MKRVLVTGSAGFVGSHFVEHFLKQTDWEVVGLDSFRHRGDSLRVYQDPARYSIFTADLSAPISPRLASKMGDFDYLVNVASESHVDRSITDPVPFVDNNVRLILNVLEYARQRPVKKFIQISTDEVYGPAPEGVDHPEWAPILPSNPYSASKAAQEAIAISYWRTYNIPLVITNTMNMIGERQDTEKFLPMIIRRIQAGEEVTIHGSEAYIGKRHYLHARNLADAVLFLLKEYEPVPYFDTPDLLKPSRFNVVGDEELDNLQMARLVAEILGKPLRYKLEDFHLTRPGHDRRYSLDGRKIRALGWKAPVPLRESLERTIHWSLEQKEWL